MRAQHAQFKLNAKLYPYLDASADVKTIDQ
jgi:hypothetical protein